MKDKICVITGGTDGIGKAAAHALALRGAKLLIHGRDPEKGARAVAEITARSQNPAVEFLQADFSSLADVRRLATTVMQRAPHVDVLINNAGGIFGKRMLSKDGYEMTLAVNHLAPFLLTHLLLDTLKSGGPSRIVTTSSHAHRGARIEFDDLQSQVEGTSGGYYFDCKRIEPSRNARDDTVAEQLWKLSEELVGITS